MTVEKPAGWSQVWLLNAIASPIDVTINGADQPFVTGLEGLKVGPEFQVKGQDDSPFGTYTFSARLSGAPGGRDLAAVSVELSEGLSFSAVLHERPDGTHQFSAYRNDFSPSDAPRMTVRHTAHPQTLSWRIEPKEFKAEIPRDVREGTLENGQWQVATRVVENDYRLTVLRAGQVVAEHPDLELEHEKDRTVYIVDNPTLTSADSARRFVLVQEFQLPRGAPPPAQVSEPSAPASTRDQNASLIFDCERVTAWQTNSTSATVSAVDPDGVITDLAVGHITPKVGGIFIPDHGVTPSTALGEPATAEVTVLGDVPAGEYRVEIVANTRSLGARERCTLVVVIRPITIDRLLAVIEQYRQTGALEASVADSLGASLAQVEENLALGMFDAACRHTKVVMDMVQSKKGKGIAVSAGEHLEREMSAFRMRLGCG